MCTTQVLLLSRDVMRRNFGGDVNRRVCRKLFETSDPSLVNPTVFLKKMQDEIRKKDTERWNFDFLTETPLPGRYQWEPVIAGTSTKKEHTTTVSNRNDRVDETAQPIVEEILRASSSSAQSMKIKEGAGAPLQQKITEFMPKKKRRASNESTSPKSKTRRVSRHTTTLSTSTRLR